MSDLQSRSSSKADLFRLNLIHASFRIADEEHRRRAGGRPEEPGETSQREVSEDSEEAARLDSALRGHAAGLSSRELELLRLKLAHRLLVELDRTLAARRGAGDPLPEVAEVPLGAAAVAAEADVSSEPRMALVSMPWMSPRLPSIQLATLAATLKQEGIAADVHELYVDYAARLGLNLYSYLGSLLGYLQEWVFCRHYYGPEIGDDLSGMSAQDPFAGTSLAELHHEVLEALEPVTGKYLDDVMADVDWSRYDIVGCSLTISQLGASMAFVRRLKLRSPDTQVIFGGTQCASPMGQTILRICPYVDVVVHVEGELVLGEVVRRLRAGDSLEGLPGVSYRDPGGEVRSGPEAGLLRPLGERPPLDYDAYFRRLARLDLVSKMDVWLPFESSRGCWYGQKSQCTFCGLHEIMEFRAREAGEVLAELERLSSRYGIRRFFSVDLIMPREYLRTLLPEITARGHEWLFFYEIKANLRRQDLEVLADSGVRWVQPGIESLDTEILRLMKKGVSALQNVLLLKWSQELGIRCAWNFLTSLPGETAEAYERIVRLMPRLSHLRPPAAKGSFQLHRFSPYFDRPEEHGIRRLGAHPMFRFAFPIPEQDLNDLVYLHDFAYASGPPVDSPALDAALRHWRRRFHRGASLGITFHPDGSSRIDDGREVDEPARVHHLGPAETELYRLLESGTQKGRVRSRFERRHPEMARALDSKGGVERVLEAWIRDGLVLEIDGRAVSLALDTGRIREPMVAPPRPYGEESLLSTPWQHAEP